jgi:hypothetical protein
MSPVDNLAVQLRGVQLARAEAADVDVQSVGSVATSCIPMHPTQHAAERQRERWIGDREIRKCIKSGAVQQSFGGRLKHTFGHMVVITGPAGLVVTAYDMAGVNGLRKRLMNVWIQWVATQAYRKDGALNAFTLWKLVTNVLAKKARQAAAEAAAEARQKAREAAQEKAREVTKAKAVKRAEAKALMEAKARRKAENKAKAEASARQKAERKAAMEAESAKRRTKVSADVNARLTVVQVKKAGGKPKKATERDARAARIIKMNNACKEVLLKPFPMMLRAERSGVWERGELVSWNDSFERTRLLVPKVRHRQLDKIAEETIFLETCVNEC